MPKTVFDWDAHLAKAAKTFEIALRKELIIASLIAVKEAKLNATKSPKVRSGRLRSSIVSEVRKGAKGPEMALKAGSGQGVRYAAQREYGGTITPVRSRYLTIPLDAALTGAGVARYPSARSVPGLFLIRSLAGNLLLVQKVPGGIQPMYVLKDSVTQRAQPYLRPALQVAFESLSPKLAAAVTTAVLPP